MSENGSSIEKLEPPRCGFPRKRDGEPCQSTALIEGRCAIHGGRQDPSAMGQKSGEVRRETSVRAFLRSKVEENGQRIWDGYNKLLDATQTYVSKDGEIVTVPDFRTQLAARDALLTQAYGKPPISIESTGEPVAIVYLQRVLPDDEEALVEPSEDVLELGPGDVADEEGKQP